MMNTTKKPSRRDRVYQQLSELTQQMTPKRIETADFRDHDAAGIGKSLNITINNTCMELNALVKDGLVVKILGRPVYFFAREDLEQVVGRKISQCIWDNYGQFRELLNRDEAAPAPAAYRQPAIPAAPPASASTTLSVSSCRTMRPRPAPSAMRTAASRLPAALRASERLARLRHCSADRRLASSR